MPRAVAPGRAAIVGSNSHSTPRLRGRVQSPTGGRCAGPRRTCRQPTTRRLAAAVDPLQGADGHSPDGRRREATADAGRRGRSTASVTAVAGTSALLRSPRRCRPEVASLDAIELRGVSRSFEIEGTRLVALDGLDLRVAEREVVAIVGPNGCGKSTLLRVIERPPGARSGHRALVRFDRRRRRCRASAWSSRSRACCPGATSSTTWPCRSSWPAWPVPSASAAPARRSTLTDLASFADALPAPALGRHGAASRAGPGAGAASRRAPAGRALQRPRRHDPRAARMPSCWRSGAGPGRRSCSSPTASPRRSSWPTGCSSCRPVLVASVGEVPVAAARPRRSRRSDAATFSAAAEAVRAAAGSGRGRPSRQPRDGHVGTGSRTRDESVGECRAARRRVGR